MLVQQERETAELQEGNEKEGGTEAWRETRKEVVKERRRKRGKLEWETN